MKDNADASGELEDAHCSIHIYQRLLRYLGLVMINRLSRLVGWTIEFIESY